MGRPKLLLPLGPRRVIEHVLAALAQSQIDETVVVLPPGDTELASAVRSHRAHAVSLAQPTADMRASIVHGLDYAEQTWTDRQLDGFLVAPADHPTISSRVVDQLVARWYESDRSIFIPTYNGRRGHPVLLTWRHAQQLRDLQHGGLNRLVAENAAHVEECPCDEPTVLDDLDTPGDYERLLRRGP
jgi:molybdenum cofactor cytidylyltransferase